MSRLSLLACSVLPATFSLLPAPVACLHAAEKRHFLWRGKGDGMVGDWGTTRTNRVEYDVEAGKGTCVIVAEGKPYATLVLAATPTRSAQVAAAELKHYVRKRTGIELPVVTDEARPFEGSKVLIGESKLTTALGLRNKDLAPQEYLLRSYGDILVLMGRDELEYGLTDYDGNGLWSGYTGYYDWSLKPDWTTKLGSVYAVDTFLERFCGVRWYMPGPLGEVCPESDSLAVKDVDLRLKPWSEYRRFEPDVLRDYFHFIGSGKEEGYASFPVKYGWREIHLWALRMKALGCEAYGANHSLIGEWFAKRFPNRKELFAQGYDQSVQLCLSNPATLKQVTQDAQEYFEGKSNYGRGHGRYYPVMPHDYGGRWCKCDLCRRLLKPETGGFWNGSASDYVWGFVNEVARRVKKRDGSRWISNCAYAAYTLPPQNVKLEDNVAVTICRVLVDCFKDEGYRAFQRKLIPEWAKRAKRWYLWEYYDHIQMNGRESMFPGVFPHAAQEDMKLLKANGCRGMFIEMNSVESCIPNFAQDYLNLYVALKLLQDTDLDVDELLREHCQLFYGPAGEPMNRFFLKMEERFTNPDNWKLEGEQMSSDWERVCPKPVLNEFRTLMQEATSLAHEEPYLTRVRLMREAVLGMMEKNFAKHANLVRNRARLAIRRVVDPARDLEEETNHIARFLTIAGDPTDTRTEAWIGYDDRTLYVRVKCHEEEMSSVKATVMPQGKSQSGVGVCEDDSIELFLDPGRTVFTYYQVLVNTNGAVEDAKWNWMQGGDFRYSTGAEATVTKAADSWTVDLRVPLAKPTGGKGIRGGEQWGLNLCRNRPRKDSARTVYTCWSPTGGSFHEPRRFGIVSFHQATKTE